ncbi:MscS mechanosensitive ion channel [Calothrix sp. NIES-4071]|nr:MscS mechanosensitive ion channel [Calothrix sp. NIES-4071]BAZ58511.1 MscS mechanosensitive ion channel [Calothrix sp. NIES-4105]
MLQMQLIVPILFVFLGLVAGIIGENVIYKRLKDFVGKRQIPGSEIIIKSLHRMTLLWFVIAGCYAAILAYPSFTPDINSALQKILTIVFLYSVTVVFARLTAGFVNIYVRRSTLISASLFANIAKTAVLVLGTLILLQTVGIQITPVITTLGISGLAVGLALKDTL